MLSTNSNPILIVRSAPSDFKNLTTSLCRGQKLSLVIIGVFLLFLYPMALSERHDQNNSVFSIW